MVPRLPQPTVGFCSRQGYSSLLYSPRHTELLNTVSIHMTALKTELDFKNKPFFPMLATVKQH